MTVTSGGSRPARRRLDAPLLLGGGHRGRRQRARVRRGAAGWRPSAPLPLGGREPAVAAQLSQGRQQPPARQPSGAAAQVTAGKAGDHPRRRSERREQVTVLGVEPVAVRRQLAVADGRGPVRAAGRPPRAGPGRGPRRARATYTTSTSSPMAADIGPTRTPSPNRPTRGSAVSSSRVRTSRARRGPRRLDGVEPGQPAEHRLDRRGRVLLLRRKLGECLGIAVQVGEEVDRPAAQLGPRRHAAGAPQLVAEGRGEPLQVEHVVQVALQARDPRRGGVHGVTVGGQLRLAAVA